MTNIKFKYGNEKDFTFATKDMNMAEYIGDLIEIGVRSLKVEGTIILRPHNLHDNNHFNC